MTIFTIVSGGVGKEIVEFSLPTLDEKRLLRKLNAKLAKINKANTRNILGRVWRSKELPTIQNASKLAKKHL